MHPQDPVDYRIPPSYGNPRLRTMYSQLPPPQPSMLIQRTTNNYNMPIQKHVGSNSGTSAGNNNGGNVIGSGGYNKKPYRVTTAPTQIMSGQAVTGSVPNSTMQDMTASYPQQQQVPQIPVASAKKLHLEQPREPFVKKVVHQTQQQQQQSYNNQPTKPVVIKKRPTPAPRENGQETIETVKVDTTTGILQNSTDDSKSKEKTPMCLVNELARYNKITHQYRLISESGPAHKKKFTVTLRVGDEEYTADGPSIKKAQHTAAGQALQDTKYPHPPAKSNRVLKAAKKSFGNVTPTVELNALAMKQGLNVVYIQKPNTAVPPPPLVNKQRPPYSPSTVGYGGVALVDPQNNENHPPNVGNVRPSSYGKYAPPLRDHSVSLKVGYRTFEGTGITPQAARHNAASSALKVLKAAQMQGEAIQEDDEGNDSDLNDLKSPISLVHEIALKRKLTVTFEVKQERGPPHMKTFVTLCKVGDIVTEGEGNGKKISRKRAAEKMLDELKQLGPPPVSTESNNSKLLKKKGQPVKKKNRNLVKENVGQQPTEETNPISYLIQLQQSRKEKEPEYTLVEERGAPRRREFLMEVSAAGLTATGSGPNKKTAKKNAALNLLSKMGITSDSMKPATESTKSNKRSTDNKDAAKSAKNSRQIVPGVLALPTEQASQVQNTPNEQPEAVTLPKKVSHTKSAAGSSKQLPSQQSEPPRKESTPLPNPPAASASQPPPSTTTARTKPEVTQESTSSQPATSSTSTDSTSDTSSAIIVNPKQQLLYLAQILDFQVQFSDFPKGNHGEFLTLVTLSTNPPQLLHGSGKTMEESNDQAAMKALTLLRKLGLGIIKKSDGDS